jgi:hypothetical protein
MDLSLSFVEWMMEVGWYMECESVVLLPLQWMIKGREKS